MKHILFVCSANKDRSRTADDYFSERYEEFEFDPAGTNQKLCHQLGTCALTEMQFVWADIIIVMEIKHRKFITTAFPKVEFNRIEVLHIPDRYVYFQRDLIDLLTEKALPIFDQ